FGRWIQALDGRKVFVILDTCYSGGQIQGAAKSVSLVKADTIGVKGLQDDSRAFFLGRRLLGLKDIGQKDAAGLASSRGTQVSLERKEQDMSVMTFFLVELLRNGSNALSVPDSYRYVKPRVAAYVKEKFPGYVQTPVFVDQATTTPAMLRPGSAAAGGR